MGFFSKLKTAADNFNAKYRPIWAAEFKRDYKKYKQINKSIYKAMDFDSDRTDEYLDELESIVDTGFLLDDYQDEDGTDFNKMALDLLWDKAQVHEKRREYFEATEACKLAMEHGALNSWPEVMIKRINENKHKKKHR